MEFCSWINCWFIQNITRHFLVNVEELKHFNIYKKVTLKFTRTWNVNVSQITRNSPVCWKGSLRIQQQKRFASLFLCEGNPLASNFHDDIMKWKHFLRYWPFVWGIHWSPVNSPHKGQWRGGLMFSLICVWIDGWVNSHEAGDLRRHHAHYDVIIMPELMLTADLLSEANWPFVWGNHHWWVDSPHKASVMLLCFLCSWL